MSQDREQAVVNLRVVTALAQKLADDLEANRLWEGDFSDGMAQLQKAVRNVPNIR